MKNKIIKSSILILFMGIMALKIDGVLNINAETPNSDASPAVYDMIQGEPIQDEYNIQTIASLPSNEEIEEFHSITARIAEEERIEQERIAAEEAAKKAAEEEKAKKAQEFQTAIQNASIYTNGINIKNPFYVTGLTAEQYDVLLSGTRLDGCGNIFVELENTYGVNGIYAIAVAKLESQLGGSTLGQANNFFGFRFSNGWAKFDTKEEGIMYFGKLMNAKLYKGKTIAGIAPSYCNEGWGIKVSEVIDYLVAKL